MAERKKKPSSVNFYGFKYTGDMHRSIALSYRDVDPMFTGKRKFSTMWTPYTENTDSDAPDEVFGVNQHVNPSLGYEFRKSAVVTLKKGGETPKKITFKTYKRVLPSQNPGLDDPKGDQVEKKTLDVEESSDKE